MDLESQHRRDIEIFQAIQKILSAHGDVDGFPSLAYFDPEQVRPLYPWLQSLGCTHFFASLDTSVGAVLVILRDKLALLREICAAGIRERNTGFAMKGAPRAAIVDLN